MQHKINILIHISIKFVHDLKVESIAGFSLRVEQSNTLVTVKVFLILLCDINNSHIFFVFL